MRKKEIRNWKKVFLSDLTYIAYELKEIVESPSLVILEGPLGAGKTTFTKVFAGDDEVLSPTYSVLSETKSILHADFYRIKEREEILHLEFPLYLEGKAFFLVEWGAKYFESIMKELPENFETYLLQISLNDSSSSEEEQSRNFDLFEIEED